MSTLLAWLITEAAGVLGQLGASAHTESRVYYCPATNSIGEDGTEFHDCFQEWQHITVAQADIVKWRQGVDVRDKYRKMAP